MRFDTPVFFVTIDERTYNAATGNYETPDETHRLYRANVMDTTDVMKRLVYGTVKQESRTVFIKGTAPGNPDYINIDGIRYKIDKVRHRKLRSSYIVSGVQ